MQELQRVTELLRKAHLQSVSNSDQVWHLLEKIGLLEEGVDIPNWWLVYRRSFGCHSMDRKASQSPQNRNVCCYSNTRWSNIYRRQDGFELQEGDQSEVSKFVFPM